MTRGKDVNIMIMIMMEMREEFSSIIEVFKEEKKERVKSEQCDTPVRSTAEGGTWYRLT